MLLLSSYDHTEYKSILMKEYLEGESTLEGKFFCMNNFIREDPYHRQSKEMSHYSHGLVLYVKK